MDKFPATLLSGQLLRKTLKHTHRASQLQAPQLDVDKFFEEIMLDVPYHNDPLPFPTHSTQKKDDSISRLAPCVCVVGGGSLTSFGLIPELSANDLIPYSGKLSREKTFMNW